MANAVNSSAGQFFNYAPRVISAIAGTVAIISLLILGGQYLTVVGTTTTIATSIHIGCLTTAKWSAVVTAGMFAIGVIKDLSYALLQGSTLNLPGELLITTLSPFCGIAILFNRR